MVRDHFGVTDHQGPAKGPPGRKNVCKWEGKYVSYFREMIYHVYVYSGKINDYVCKTQYINRSFFCTQPAQYFRGDIPLSIWINKEFLLLNDTVVLKRFYLY